MEGKIGFEMFSDFPMLGIKSGGNLAKSQILSATFS
jgi:hypothetical protein